MKHLGCIILVLLESLKVVGDEALSTLLVPAGGFLVVLDQFFGLVEQDMGMFISRLDVVGVVSRSALA